MRYTKIVILALAGALLIGATAVEIQAALSSANPGLPSVTVAGYAGGGAVARNQYSVMCVACHSRIPYSAAGANATHFVSNDAAPTNSGGGWTATEFNRATAERNGGEYFHIGAWSTAGIYSKYGNVTGPASATNAAAGTVGYELATTGVAAATLNGYDIICESCHNIVRNVAGGNNLVEAPGDQVGAANGFQEATNSTLCVGCHGWMYDSNDAANAINVMANNGHYDNAWNGVAEVAGTERSNNSSHYIGGAKIDMNHHVLTGDAIDQTLATAGLLWRDVYTIPPGSARADITTAVGGNSAMPQQTTWQDGKTKSSVATRLNCLNCHMAGHGGDSTAGASILRDTNLGGRATGSIQRIGDSPRTWWDFTDENFCMDCHQVR